MELVLCAAGAVLVEDVVVRWEPVGVRGPGGLGGEEKMRWGWAFLGWEVAYLLVGRCVC